MKINNLSSISFCLLSVLSMSACNCETDAAIKQPSILVSEMAQMKDGITAIGDDSLAFVLFAPHKEEVDRKSVV